MIEISLFRNERDRVIEGLKKRNLSDEQLLIVDEIIKYDDNRKSTQTKLDDLLSQINKMSDEVGSLFKSGKIAEGNTIREQVSQHKELSKGLEIELNAIKDALDDMIIQLPNIPHTSVPFGRTPEENEVHQSWSKAMPELHDNAQPHWELAEKYNLISFKDGVKLTGSGFPVYIGKGAKLQRALINFFLDEADKAGYKEYQPPLMVNKESAMATGQLPDKEGQMYYVTKDEFYLIPTAEVPLTNIYRDVIVSKNDLPIKLTGYTPCFRREAGSYGSDVKGLNRLHQFDKVEIVQIQHPDQSYDAIMGMVSHVEKLLEKLELPFRILRLCGGDMGFNSALTFDFETYSAAQQKWLEVSSVSNFETFQSNRLKLRFKDEDGKTKLAHTLNGSALALARIVATLLENHQTPEGIKIPKALIPYTGFDFIN
jgi:seryl-tRNA synthetase